MPPKTSISDTSHQPTIDAARPQSAVRLQRRHDAAAVRPRRDVRGPRVLQRRRRRRSDERQRGGQTDRDERQLKDVGVGDRPHPAEHGVRGRHDRGEQDRRRERHAEQDAECRADRDEQLGAPEQLAGERRQEQHRRPSFAEARLERIDQRREAVAAHDAGEEHAAENQADAEAEAALDAELDRATCRRLRWCRADSRRRPTSRSSSARRSRAASRGRRRSDRRPCPRGPCATPASRRP